MEEQDVMPRVELVVVVAVQQRKRFLQEDQRVAALVGRVSNLAEIGNGATRVSHMRIHVWTPSRASSTHVRAAPWMTRENATRRVHGRSAPLGSRTPKEEGESAERSWKRTGVTERGGTAVGASQPASKGDEPR